MVLATEAADRLRRAEEAIGSARAEVAELALGLYPRALVAGGLVGALHASLRPSRRSRSASRASDGATAGAEADATLYFLCAEAARECCPLRPPRRRSGSTWRPAGALLTVVVEDNGVGGAGPWAEATGLRGLRDRIEALGGELEIESRRPAAGRASWPPFRSTTRRIESEGSSSAHHSTFVHAPPRRALSGRPALWAVPRLTVNDYVNSSVTILHLEGVTLELPAHVEVFVLAPAGTGLGRPSA